jgi:hypothetical protein
MHSGRVFGPLFRTANSMAMGFNCVGIYNTGGYIIIMCRNNSNENARKVRCDEVEDEKCQHVERSAREPSHCPAIENQEPEIRSVVAQGDVVVIVAHERGRFRDSRRPYALHWVQMFMFRDGRVARFRQICDSTAMLEA